MNRPSSRYQAMELQGMSGPRLVVTIYAHLLAALSQGHRAIGEKDHETRSRSLCRARDLAYELFFTLDREAGGEVAANLAALYQFYIREITQVDLHPDATRLTRLIEMVGTLNEAWRTAAAQLAESPAAVIA